VAPTAGGPPQPQHQAAVDVSWPAVPTACTPSSSCWDDHVPGGRRRQPTHATGRTIHQRE
jgi:hypothetical protein